MTCLFDPVENKPRNHEKQSENTQCHSDKQRRKPWNEATVGVFREDRNRQEGSENCSDNGQSPVYSDGLFVSGEVGYETKNLETVMIRAQFGERTRGTILKADCERRMRYAQGQGVNGELSLDLELPGYCRKRLHESAGHRAVAAQHVRLGSTAENP